MRPVLQPFAIALLSTCLPVSYAQEGESIESVVTSLRPIVVSPDSSAWEDDRLTPPATVLTGEKMILKRRGTLGDMLEGEPGVHSDSFGGGASRPVIRGQTAPRVKVLSDGSEILDASMVSPDHVITADTGLAREIEILRGPSALLYGGGAIAGVVNVLDSKIPTEIPVGGVEGSIEMSAETAARERSGAIGISAGEGAVALRVEGARRRADDYRVPHWTERRVPNSNAESTSGSVGVSWVGSRGFLGAAYTYRQDVYGLPGHSHEYEDCHPHGPALHCGAHDHDLHDHDDDEHGHADHTPTAHVRSDRVDVRGELYDPFPGFTSLKFRGGHTNYRHEEREDGVPGTTFTNRGFDGRLELAHEPIGDWNGIVGMQAAQFDFASSGGSESFVPRSRTQTGGVFLLENYVLNDWRFEFGARHDWQRVTPDSRELPSYSGRTLSFSAGAVWNFTPGYSASASITRSHRMPDAQELYARGLHLATLTYEVGNPNLDKESATTFDFGIKRTEGDLQFAVNLYLSRINNYIYGNTLDQHDGFRLIEYAQQDSLFNGLEAEVSYRLTGSTVATVFGDYVRGRLKGGAGNLPRIPAARLGARVQYDRDSWAGFVEFVQVLRQKRVASFEEDSAGYGLLGAGVSYRGKLADTDYVFYLNGTNLLNRLGYNHVSFISREAPVRGRSVMAGVRVEF